MLLDKNIFAPQTNADTHKTYKQMKKILFIALILSLTGCEKGYFGLAGYELSPARRLAGTWKGTTIRVTESEAGPGTPICWIMVVDFELILKEKGNDVTGVLNGNVTNYSIGACGIPPVTFLNSSVIGKVSGVKLSLRDERSQYLDGLGPTQYDFTFTSSNMEGTATEVASSRPGLTSATNGIKLYKQ